MLRRLPLANPASRFEAARVEYDPGEVPDQGLEIYEDQTHNIIAKNDSPDLSFSYSLNPYRGCAHGCAYCYARPSHEYLGFGAGTDFERRLVVKPKAPELLREAFEQRSWRGELLVFSGNTDCYQPIESRFELTRRCLEVCLEYKNPVHIITKGTLIERDIDILAEMGRAGLARVGISLTTLDSSLSRRMEPRVPQPARRLEVIRRLSAAGCPVRVMVAPVIPALTDHELEPILEAARGAGATSASMIVLRLPKEVAPLFRDWLAEHYPDRAARVMGRVRDLHGGRDYDASWGRRFTGQGVSAALMQQRFRQAKARLGFADDQPPLRCDLFRPPPHPGDQPDLFSI